MSSRQTDDSPPWHAPVVRAWGLWTGVALLLLFAVRQHTFTEPLEADEAIYALIARDWQRGGRPYDTLWDNKPLGTFVVYRMAIALFGYTESAPKLSAFLASALVLVLVAALLSWWRCNVAFGAMILCLFALSNGVTSCFANGANMEVFVNPLVVLALWATLALRRTRQERYFWLAWLSLTLSATIKQVTLPFFLVPPIVLIACISRRPSFVASRAAGAVLTVVIAHVLLYGAFGYSPAVVVQQLVENRRYVEGREGGSIFGLLRLMIGVPFDRAIRPLSALVVAAIGVLVFGVVRKRDGEVAIVAAFFVAGLMAISLPGSKLPHYYLLLVPLLFPAVALYDRFLPGRVCRLGASIALIGLTAYVYMSYWRLHPHVISYNKYGHTNWFVQDRVIGYELKQRGITDTRIYVDGTHPGIYFYSDTMPTQRFFAAWTYTSLGVTTWDDEFALLRQAMPPYCVLLNKRTADRAAFWTWLDTHYEWVGRIASARVYVRRGQ